MLNHITIMGRFTRDAEMRKTGSGNSVANFSVAVERDFKNDAGEKETDFIDCVAWRGTADFISKYFHKGSMAVISGRLQIRSWTDDAGNKRKAAEVIVDNIYFGESKKDSVANSSAASFAPSASAAGEPTQTDFAMLDGDDAQLPF